MKCCNFQYTHSDDLKNVRFEYGIDPMDENILVQVFSGSLEIDYLKDIIQEIKTVFPKAQIIGTTTSGEILNGSVSERTVTLSVVDFEKSRVKSRLYPLASHSEAELGQRMAKEMLGEKSRVLFLFSDGMVILGDKLLESISQVRGDVPVVGGRAGDNGLFEETYVFTQDGIITEGVACAVVDSDVLSVCTDHTFAWRPIGKPMRVDKADGNRIYTIDNTPVAKLYEMYLGEEIAEGLPMSAISFPLVTKQGDLTIGRVPIRSYDDGSMDFIGSLPEGASVQFAFGNVEMILEEGGELSGEMSGMGADRAIFIYSCIGRKMFMGTGGVEMEVEALKRLGPTVGFFTNGEFFHHQGEGRHVLLNETMTVAVLSEEKAGGDLLQPEPTHYESNHQVHVIKAIAHLVDKVSTDLEKTQNQLQQSEQMASLGQLVAGVAHNLSTPTGTAVTASSYIENKIIELLRRTAEKSLTRHQMFEYMEGIAESSQAIFSNLQKVKELIDSLRNLAVTQSGDALQTFDLVLHLKDVLKGLEFSLKRHGHRVSVDFPESLRITSFPSAYNQIIVNLTNNAIMYAFENGQQGNITVVLEADDTQMVLTFTDDGQGIAAENLSKIFEPFFTTDMAGGTGIGLSLVYNLVVVKLGGKIVCESEQGKGTTFTMRMPTNISSSLI